MVGLHRRQKKALVLLFLLTISFWVIQTGKSQEPDREFRVSSSSYYLKGSSFSITVLFEPFMEYSLTIKDPNNTVVWQQNRIMPESGSDFISLPIPDSFNEGTYTISANSSNHKTTIWTSLIDPSGLKPASFPYTRNHKAVNYTITAKGFSAESNTGHISVNYPSLPISFQVNAYQNNMLLVERLRNTNLGITIDLTYAFIHAGTKIIINGTIPQPTQYSFKMDSLKSLKKVFSTVRSGMLIFDWSDLQKASQQFSYDSDSHILTVNIPQTFSIDPYLFESGFETHDFSEWTGTTGNPEVTGTQPHCGSYSMEANASGESCYYSFYASPQNTIFHRFYVNVTELPDANGETLGFGLGYGGGGTTPIFQTGVYYSGGTMWCFNYRNGASWTSAYSEPTTININTWYCVELYWKLGSTDGEVHLYINDVDVANVTGKDTNDYGGCDEIQIGTTSFSLGGEECTIYQDCVIIHTSKIGLEASNTAPSVGSISNSPSRIEENINFNLSCTINDADGIADFENCTLTLDDDWTHSFSLLWTNSTNTFSEDSDPSNYCTLHSGTRTTVNSTAYTLTWTLLIRESFPEEAVDVVALVYDSSGDSGTSTSNDLFIFNHKDYDKPSLPPTEPTEPTQPDNQTGLDEQPGPGPGQVGQIDGNLWVIGGIIAVAVVLASAYSQAPTLRKASQNWKGKKKSKGFGWGKDKGKKKKKWKKEDLFK